MKWLLGVVILGIVEGLIFEEDLGEPPHPRLSGQLRPEDIVGVNDEYINVTCTINRKYSVFENRFNASDLRFNVTGHVVSNAPTVLVRNEDTAELFYKVNTSHDNSWVDCFVQYNATSIVGVGIPARLNVGLLTPDDPEITVGSSLTVFCDINPEFPSLHEIYDARNIYFKLNRSRIDNSYVHVAQNNTQAVLVYPNITIDKHDQIVTCYVGNGSQDDIYVDSQHIVVGYPPHKAKIGDVRIRNWEMLQFDYQKPRNINFPTHVSSWWKMSNDSSYNKCDHKKVEWDSPEQTTCEVDNFEQQLAVGNRNETLILLKVNASNTAGNSEEIRKINFNEYVQPNPVAKLKAKPFSSRLVISWKSPKNGKDLLYEISETNEWNDAAKMLNVSEERAVLDDLIPYTNYTVSVRCRSVLGGFWSETETITQRTKPAVPQVQPEMTPGIFHLKQTSSWGRTVTIFWKPVPRRFSYGPLESYHIEFTEILHGKKPDQVTVSEDQNSVALENLKTTSEYLVSVTVENREGVSAAPHHSVIIPKQSLVNRKIANMPTVVALNETAVEVRWNSNTENITLFWCRNKLATEKTCQGEMHWNMEQPTVVYLREDSVKDYQFGIASDLGDRYSGIQWLRCVYHINKPAEPPLIRLVEQGETWLKIYLDEKPCHNLQGFITRYDLKWCPHQANTHRCPDNSGEMYVDKSESNQFTIENLSPNQLYRIQVASLTENNKRSYEMESIIQETKAPMGGLPLWAVVGIVALFLLILCGLSCFCWCCRSKVKKFFGSKKGTPVDPPRLEDGTSEEDIELLEKRNSPTGEEIGAAGDAVPDGPRPGAYGVSTSEDSADSSDYAGSLLDVPFDSGLGAASIESTSGYPVLPTVKSESAESYTHGDHVIDETVLDAKARKKLPHVYVDNKHPLGEATGSKKTRQEPNASGSLVTDGAGAISLDKGQCRKGPNSSAKEVVGENSQFGSQSSGSASGGRSSDSYNLPSPVPPVGEARYDRGNSTDSSESGAGGARYARGTMNIESLRETSVSSTEDNSSPGVAGDDVPNFNNEDQKVVEEVKKDNEDQKVVEEVKRDNEDQKGVEEVKRDNEDQKVVEEVERDNDEDVSRVDTIGSAGARTIPVAVSNFDASGALSQQDENPGSQTDTVLSDTNDDANNSDGSYEDSEDDDPGRYTKQKQIGWNFEDEEDGV